MLCVSCGSNPIHHQRRQLCNTCYWRMRAAGEFKKQSIEDRFWGKVSITNDDECWMWVAATNEKGYGYFIVSGQVRHAHRFAYQITYGDPGNSHVLHRCDTPSCVNPNHLFLGTNADNVADKIAKGRQPVGSHTSNAILTEEQVIRFRSEFAANPQTMKQFAQSQGISESTMYYLITKRTWKHI